MWTPPRRFGLLLAACLFSLATMAVHAGKDSKPLPEFRPDPEADGAPALRGVTFHEEGAAHSIRVTYIDAETRLAYINKALGLTTDPFVSRPDAGEMYMSFMVEVENLGNDNLVFNPRKSWLSTNRKEIKTPLGMPDLSFSYRVVGRDLPPAYRRVGELLFDQTREVSPGSRVHGLLIYPAVNPRTRSFQLDIRLVLPNGDAVQFSAPYRKLKEKKKKDK